VTAHAVLGERERAIAAGMSDYIAKPVTPAGLATILSKWLKLDPGPSTEERAVVIPREHDPVLTSQRRSAKVIELFLRFAPKQDRFRSHPLSARATSRVSARPRTS
jgi:hypothetical protein